MMDVFWDALEDQLEDIEFYAPVHDVPAMEWHQMMIWNGSYGDNPPTASSHNLEPHPTEPYVEQAAPINHQQQSYLQSGPEFRQEEPYIQLQENNTEWGWYTHEQNMDLSAEFGFNVAEMDGNEQSDVAWVSQDQLDYTNNYTPAHDYHAPEWHQMLNGTVYYGDNPPIASAHSYEQHSYEQHPAEPHVELADNESDSFSPAGPMIMWPNMFEEREHRDNMYVAWGVVEDQVQDIDIYTPAHDVPPVEWHQMYNWTGYYGDNPPIASALSLEPHPIEPHVELADPINHQQQSVLQSGPEFRHEETNILIQENNSERDSYSPAGPMIMWPNIWEEREHGEVPDVAWAVVEDQLQDIDIYTPPDTHPSDDEPSLGWRQIFNWAEIYRDNPEVVQALSLEQHPAEPYVEMTDPINHQQQSVLQSGPEFSQDEPNNQPQINNVPAAIHTRHLEVRLAPVGLFKGKMIYGAPGDRVPSPVNPRNSEFSHSKRKCERQQNDEKAYTPKPPNAFRPLRKSTRGSRKSPGSATVNTKVKKKINNVPTAMHTRHLEVRLAPVGLLKRKCESQQDDELAYINKPPNAFMIFMKEQRPYVLARSKSTDSATVNTIIGKKWRALSDNEQEKYYQEAKTLRQLHKQLYPDWSAKDNYGQKQKRVRK